MLYDVLLHEIGHLQIIDENRRSARLRFAQEKLAQAFATQWRKNFWSLPFPHEDAVHDPPSAEELRHLEVGRAEAKICGLCETRTRIFTVVGRA